MEEPKTELEWKLFGAAMNAQDAIESGEPEKALALLDSATRSEPTEGGR